MPKKKPDKSEDYHILVSRIMFKHDTLNALKWLKSKGYDIQRRTYNRRLVKLDESAKQRLFEIAYNFDSIAADEITKFQNIESEMYKQYHIEKQPTKKVMILKAIAELQPMMTALYDQTRIVLEGKMYESAKNDPALKQYVKT